MMTPNHTHKATLISVHDGDTFTCLAKLDFFVRVEIEVRLHGYSAPELNQEGGATAHSDLVQFFDVGKDVVINSVFSEKVTEKQEEGTRSFTRWVCDVERNGINVSDYMNKIAPKGGN